MHRNLSIIVPFVVPYDLKNFNQKIEELNSKNFLQRTSGKVEKLSQAIREFKNILEESFRPHYCNEDECADYVLAQFLQLGAKAGESRQFFYSEEDIDERINNICEQSSEDPEFSKIVTNLRDELFEFAQDVDVSKIREDDILAQHLLYLAVLYCDSDDHGYENIIRKSAKTGYPLSENKNLMQDMANYLLSGVDDIIDRSKISITQDVRNPWNYSCKIAMPCENSAHRKVTYFGTSRLTLYSLETATPNQKRLAENIRNLGEDVNENNGEISFKIDFSKFAELEYKKTLDKKPAAVPSAATASVVVKAEKIKIPNY